MGKVVDPSLYRVVQPHYTAHPIFENMPDPLPRRHGVRIGLDKAVTLLIPEPSADDPYVGGEGYVGIGIEGHLAEIGGERGFRAPMVSAIAAYYAVNGADANPEPIKARVHEAIARADPGGRSAADIGRYCSERHLNDIVAWVRARERQRPVSARPSPATLSTAVPIDGERAPAVSAIARQLFRQRYLDPALAVSLVLAWNDVHCTPPLPREHVRSIVNATAGREAARLERRNGR